MKLPFGITVSALGALVTAVAFFLPWVSYEKATYSAASLATAVGLDAPGLKGFGVALMLVPLLAILGGGLAVWSARTGAESATRLRVWAGAAAIAGLAVALLFLGSAVLAAPPAGDFVPGAIRTDAAVKATVGKVLAAGTYTGLGAGVYLALAGLLATALGALLGRRSAAAREAWRTQDYVLLAVLAVVFGAIYWAWLQPYLWIGPIAAQPGAELLFGVWFTSGLVGGYIIRRPGAAFLTETLTSVAEVLLGAPAGPILVVTGMMEALGAELVFAATGYRRWGWPTMVVAGVAAALVALPWNWFRLGYFALDPSFLLLLLGVRIASGGLAGVVSKTVGDLLATTGSLNQFALGRERVREV